MPSCLGEEERVLAELDGYSMSGECTCLCSHQRQKVGRDETRLHPHLRMSHLCAFSWTDSRDVERIKKNYETLQTKYLKQNSLYRSLQDHLKKLLEYSTVTHRTDAAQSDSRDRGDASPNTSRNPEGRPFREALVKEYRGQPSKIKTQSRSAVYGRQSSNASVRAQLCRQ